MGGRWDDAVSALAVSQGDAVAGGANNPIELTDARTAWFVERGALDVFVVERRDGRVASTFKHVVRAEPGRIVFGADPAADGAAGGGAAELLLVAKGTADARLRRVPLSMLSDDALRDGLAEAGGRLGRGAVRRRGPGRDAATRFRAAARRRGRDRRRGGRRGLGPRRRGVGRPAPRGGRRSSMSRTRTATCR